MKVSLISVLAMAVAFSGCDMHKGELDEAAKNGHKLVMGIIQVNAEREKAGKRTTVWPFTDDMNVYGSDSTYECSSATNYFNVLFDMQHYGTDDWNPKIDGDLLSTLGKDAVVGGTISAGGLDWCIAANVAVFHIDKSWPDWYPILISANFNPKLLQRAWSPNDSDKCLPIGPKSGAAKSMFGDTAIVIVRKNGTAQVIKAKDLTYNMLYQGVSFDNEGCKFYYLTPTGIAELSSGPEVNASTKSHWKKAVK